MPYRCGGEEGGARTAIKGAKTCQDLNFTRTSKIIKLQAALKTDGQVLHVGMPCIPLGHPENFRNCIGANLGFCASFP